MQPSEQHSDLHCPTCGGKLHTGETLWTWKGKWYCTEKCVRLAMKTIWE